MSSSIGLEFVGLVLLVLASKETIGKLAKEVANNTGLLLLILRVLNGSLELLNFRLSSFVGNLTLLHM